MEEKLSWREKFAATILLLICIVMTVAQVAAVLSSRANDYAVQNGSFQVNRSGLFTDIRTYVTIILSFLGSILLFRKKKFGWVIGLCLIILFMVIMAALLIIWWNVSVAYTATIGSALFILLLAFVFLILPSARKKYRVGKYTFLPALVFLILLSAVYFFLQ